MSKARRVIVLALSVALIMVLGPFLVMAAHANLPSIPSSVLVAVGYADTEGRSGAGPCGTTCFPVPWCGSPGVEFVGSSTNYDGNPGNVQNCEDGDWDTGAIMVVNTGAAPMTLTNLTVLFPLPSSGSSVVPTCSAEMRPILFDVWFGHQYYWDNPADPAFYGGPVTVPAGGEVIFAGTSSDNTYHCPTGNYPSTGPINGTYDFDTSDAYYLNGCVPTTDPSSAPRITFSAAGYSTTTYVDYGHTIDTGGVDTGNCSPTPTDPQWGHESLGWRLINDTCGESCPSARFGPAAESSSATATVTTSIASPSSSSMASSTYSSSSVPVTSVGPTTSTSTGATSLYAVAAVVVVVAVLGGYLAFRIRRPS